MEISYGIRKSNPSTHTPLSLAVMDEDTTEINLPVGADGTWSTVRKAHLTTEEP